MKVIYRTWFQLRNNGQDLFDRFAAVCWDWALEQRRLNGKAPPKVNRNAISQSRIRYGSAHELESILAETPAAKAWGIQVSHPDQEDRNLCWTTEISILEPADHQCYCACSLWMGRSDGVMLRARRSVSRPRIVEKILTTFGGGGFFPLFNRPIALNNIGTEAQRFVGILENPKRTHPVVLVSRTSDADRVLVDVSRLSSHLATLAHVVVCENSHVSHLLGLSLPPRINVFDGGLRLYWPGFRRFSSPAEHPVWKPEVVRELNLRHEMTLPGEILKVLSEVAVHNVHQHFCSWDRLKDLSRRQAIDEAKAAGRQDELFDLFEQDNVKLTEQLRSLRQEIAVKAEELQRAKLLAETYRYALEDRKAGRNEDLTSLPPSSVEEAIDRTRDEFNPELVFALNSKSEIKNSAFDDPEALLQAFTWLATTYWKARAGEESCSNLDGSLREALPGWSYSGGQSEITLGRYREWYRCSVDGRIFELGEHIRRGVSSDPRETIRIAFTWEKAGKRVVIGYIGQHQKNAAS
jgi:hypothetical protein